LSLVDGDTRFAIPIVPAAALRYFVLISDSVVFSCGRIE
jgi:hypothetical protein